MTTEATAGAGAVPGAVAPGSGRVDYQRAHETAAPMAPERTGPLKGVRIVDATIALSGPYCTMLLADLGADVVKIEAPTGDITRRNPPFMDGDEEHNFGAYFASINRNKRGIVLDLKTDAGREALLELIDDADAFVENLRAGVMDRLGLSYEALHARNPRLVYGAIRGFGDPRTGASPYVDWPCFDVVAQSMGGIVSMTGTAEGEVIRVGPSVGDIYPATVAALGLTAAILHARETGEGQFMDVAMYDAMLALCEAGVYRFSYSGVVTRPAGSSHPQFSPFDVYPTSDGACAIAAPTEGQWVVLCRIIGREELIDDDRTRTNRRRVDNAGLVREAMCNFTKAHTTAEIVELLAGEVPVGPVNDAEDLFADPHVAARGMLTAVEHPGAPRPAVLTSPAIHYSATPLGIYRRPPLLGEHDHEVLGGGSERGRWL